MVEKTAKFEELLENSIETKLNIIASNSNDPLQILVSKMIQFPITKTLSQFHISDLLQHEIEDIFFRLTNYKVNSFVPIIDLLSDDLLLIIDDTYSEKIRIENNKLKNKKFIITKNDLTLLINNIFRYLDHKFKEALPAPYHSYYAVLERNGDLEKKLSQIIQSIETKGFGRCDICWMKIKHSDDFVKCPYCGEIFHTNHFDDWVSSKGSCPTCKKNLT